MANQADVRVRLSAEGQAEVIAAFQKIASEGKKSGHEASESFKELNNQLKDVAKTLAGGIGIVLVAEKFKEFFKSTLEGSENLTRLSRQTGLSTDLIQGFGRAARETGVDQESANNALQKFTVQVGKAGVGSKQSRDALSDLGISIKDFTKLAPDQQFQKVAQALSGITDPARRARDEVALFSKSGVQLDQALVKVGTEGLDPFVQHMKDLGVFLDTASIASIKGAAESFKNLGDTVKGAATQFLTGLVPGLQAASDELLKATTGPGVSGLKSVGEAVGKAFRGVILIFELIGDQIGFLTAKTVTFFKGLGDIIGSSTNGFKAVGASIASLNAQMTALDEANYERKKEAYEAFNKAPEAPKGVEGAAGGDGAEGAKAAALAKAQLTLLEANLTNQLALFKAHAVLVKQEDAQAYEDGTITLTQYYARRAALIRDELDKEIGILKAKRAAVAGSAVDINDPVAELNHKKDLAKLTTEIQVAELKRTAELAANSNAETKAQEKLYTDTLKSEEKLLSIAGKKTEAARLKLALDIADLDTQLRKGGTSDADRASAEGTAASQGNAKISFTDQLGDAQAGLSKLDSARKKIQDDVRDGTLFSIEGAQKIVALDKERLPELQKQADALVELARLTGDEFDQAKAEAFKERINQIVVSTNQLGQSVAALRTGFENAIGSGLTTFLNDAVSGTHTLAGAFRDMALSIIADIEKIIIKQLVLKALQSVFGGGFSGGGSVSQGGGAAAGAFAGAATGGYIRGPGTSTSDSIPALLSDKEYVVNAKATAQPGILPLLTAINQGSLRGVNGPTTVPKFASGGQVAGAALQTHKIINVLDPSLLGDHLATEPGERAVLNIIGRNPNKVRGSLG